MLLPDLNKQFEDVSYFFSEENARNMKPSESNIFENQIPYVIPNDDDDDNDDGYSDSPMNDYMEEALPMLCDDGVHGPVDSDIVSHTNELNEQRGRIHGDFDPNISYSQANCDTNTNNSVHSMLNSTVNNKIHYPFNNSDINHSADDTEKYTEKFHPSMRETSLVNGHIQSDVRTTIC